MSSLIEVVFENIAKRNATQLLMTLITSAKQTVSTQCSEDVAIMDGEKLNTIILNSALNYKDNLTALFNLRELKVGGTVLPKVLLRLVKYADQYDIDFNFDKSGLDNQNLMPLITELQNFANNLATDYDVKNVFGGMEPASDEDTRYFTNKVLGPLGARTKRIEEQRKFDSGEYNT